MVPGLTYYRGVFAVPGLVVTNANTTVQACAELARFVGPNRSPIRRARCRRAPDGRHRGARLDSARRRLLSGLGRSIAA